MLRPDADAVATTLALRRPDNRFGLSDQPILVRRTREDRLLARLGGAEVEDRSLKGLVAFGGLVRPDAIERVLDRRGEEIAMALHASYLDRTATLGAGSSAVLPAWDGLPENLRESNRAAAAHAPILFAAMGLRLVDANQAAGAPDAAPTDGEIETLARIEHRRWMVDRIDRGWRYGEKHDDLRRIHPSLVPFDRLSANDQEKDRSAVRALIAATKTAGYNGLVVREYPIAEIVVAQILPDVFGGVELRAGGRQWPEGDVGGRPELAGGVPVGLVEDEQSVCARRDGLADRMKMRLHGLGVGQRHDQRDAGVVAPVRPRSAVSE